MPHAKILVKSITFDWSETSAGVDDAAGKAFEGPNSWQAADHWLRMRALRLPEGMLGYLKHGFTVVWEDGNSYRGRYDLEPRKFNPVEGITEHVRRFVEFSAGAKKPSHMSDKDYSSILERSGADVKKSFKELLEKYQIGPFPAVGAVITFKAGTTKEEAEAILASLKGKLDELPEVEEFDPSCGGPVWYIP